MGNGFDNFFEVWFRDDVKKYFRSISTRDRESYFPHMTFVRPFSIVGSEDDVRDDFVRVCGNVSYPISFSMEGWGTFEEESYHVPVIEDGRLTKFDNELEDAVAKNVRFARRLNPTKIFHVDVDNVDTGFYCPRILEHMLRVTWIQNKRIKGSYDFVQRKFLDRGQSLNEEEWRNNVNIFEGFV